MEFSRYEFSQSALRNAKEQATYFILATACISPKPHQGLLRIEPEIRLSDYAQSLSEWLALEDSRLGALVVLENSGYDPRALGEAVLQKVASQGIRMQRGMEVLSYRAPDRPAGVHYGYSEFQMIDHLVDYARASKEYPFFVKTTGRYTYPCLTKLLDRLSEHQCEIKFACDSRDIPGFIGRQPSRSANVGLFIAMSSHFNEEIRGLYLLMKDEYRLTHVEDLIFDKLRPLHGNDGVLLRFPVNCEPKGIGGNGDNLGSLSKSVKMWIRGTGRVLLPNLWI